MTIFERVEDALDTLSPAVAYGQDDYLTEDADLPDEYLVYFLVSAPPVLHANNAEASRMYRVQVNIYNRGGLVSLPDVDAAMSAQGFQLGPAHGLPKSEDTGHFGLAKEYTYYEEA